MMVLRRTYHFRELICPWNDKQLQTWRAQRTQRFAAAFVTHPEFEAQASEAMLVEG